MLRKTFMQAKKHSLFIILSILLFGCTPPLIYRSYWQKTPVVVDGSTNDWDVPLRFFDPKTKLNYSVSNDGDNLYICIRATDNDNVSGITHNGLQIWIDTTGKRAHQVGILCPIARKKEAGSENGDKEKESQPAESIDAQTQLYTDYPDTARLNRMHQKFLSRTKQMHVSGFKTIPDGLVELPNAYGINLGTSWNNSNVLVYEISIPLKSFLKYPFSLSDSSKVLGISFNFTITQKRVNTGGSGGRGMGGGRGGMGGGGMGGSGGGMGGGSHGGGSSTESEPESIWTPFHLTTKQ